ncbi:hypothetical protein KIN20_000872 [Parelaphostrongylus tenuis]|uniref:Uncharacterized protein n=1 Tax=Parelaphostrongylus tenuis TaxID=148309 RepID=A0AAD5LVD1_PARTN|nr:hypothetical protein KIN20_000872 [Parelaphostrongylus tenuis]
MGAKWSDDESRASLLTSISHFYSRISYIKGPLPNWSRRHVEFSHVGESNINQKQTCAS